MSLFICHIIFAQSKHRLAKAMILLTLLQPEHLKADLQSAVRARRQYDLLQCKEFFHTILFADCHELFV